MSKRERRTRAGEKQCIKLLLDLIIKHHRRPEKAFPWPIVLSNRSPSLSRILRIQRCSSWYLREGRTSPIRSVEEQLWELSFLLLFRTNSRPYTRSLGRITKIFLVSSVNQYKHEEGAEKESRCKKDIKANEDSMEMKRDGKYPILSEI